jgi:methylthioribose-1-phosphate isomerase
MSPCPLDSSAIRPIRFFNGRCERLDQRLLPDEEIWIDDADYREVPAALSSMGVRGAPAIGAWFSARDIETDSSAQFYAEFERICELLGATQPTAVNLFWPLERMKGFARANLDRSVNDAEDRDSREVTHIKEIQLTPPGITVRNPALDVTSKSSDHGDHYRKGHCRRKIPRRLATVTSAVII